jgi:pimeloyl-ACP methyl ester carboxylesterase
MPRSAVIGRLTQPEQRRDAGGDAAGNLPCRAGRSARALQARDFPFHYLCGERDAKFRAIAQALAADLHLIHHAGHNAHRDNPAAVIACLAQILAS